MDTAQVKAFCARQPGAQRAAHGEPWNILVYAIGGRTFAYFKTSEPERWRFSIRVSGERFVELTAQPGIKPARYRGRHRWITIVNVRTVPADYLRELIGASYREALLSLSRARRAQALATR